MSMAWYIMAVWLALALVLLIVVGGYLYYILRVEALLRAYKHRDCRYDG